MNQPPSILRTSLLGVFGGHDKGWDFRIWGAGSLWISDKDWVSLWARRTAKYWERSGCSADCWSKVMTWWSFMCQHRVFGKGAEIMKKRFACNLRCKEIECTSRGKCGELSLEQVS
jgi:hypothetical protein